MTLGAINPKDRELLGSPATGLAGGADSRGIDAEGLGDGRQSGDTGRLHLALADAQQAESGDASPLAERVEGLTIGEQQVIKGIGAFGHGGTCNETCRKIPVATLDEPNEVCQSVAVKRPHQNRSSSR